MDNPLSDINPDMIQKRMKCLSNPVTFRIVAEILKNPEITSKELKEKTELSGSRIFYFLNLLVDAEIITWTKTEKVSTTLTRRKFEIHENFKSILKNIGDPHRIKNEKRYYILQLSIFMAIASHQLVDLIDIPDEEFENYLKFAGIPSILQYPITQERISSTFDENQPPEYEEEEEELA